ncbi:MAG: gamma carbonic anhydrase family protein [Myxococcota bacterium]
MAKLYPYRNIMPVIAESAFIAPTATLIGEVTVGPESTIWFGAVLRGDVMPIHIGARTSIQDNSVVHATGGWQPTEVGDDCVVGHSAILHGCTIGDRVLIGMGSIVLDFATVEDDAIVGAGSLVTSRTKVPAGHLCIGRPAKPIRPIKDSEREGIIEGAAVYVAKGHEYRSALSAVEDESAPK